MSRSYCRLSESFKSQTLCSNVNRNMVYFVAVSDSYKVFSCLMRCYQCHVILLGVPLDDPIQCIISDGKRIFTAAGRHIHVWKRGKKVCVYKYTLGVFHKS